MTIDAVPSSHGASSWWLRNTPKNATTRPSNAAVSSNSTVNRLGSLPWWMAAMVVRPRREPRKVRQATLKEMLSKKHARASTT